MTREAEEPRSEHFAGEVAGLAESGSSQLVELSHGDTFDLRIAPVTKRLGDDRVRMLAYNGSIPGPTLKVPQGSEVVVNVTNEGDMEATVHWHGLRLDNRSDGTPETQDPIPVGGSFSCRVAFPDPGVYWYHPHIREDYGKEMGLYGNVLVVPADPDHWAPANREVLLTLDDILLEDGRVAPFSRSETTHAAMGRFGDLMLVGGEPDLALSAQQGEVVRLYLTNTANTRVFNVALPGARMKLVGGDSGRCEREELVESVVLAPSERAVVDVLFETAGTMALEHRTPRAQLPAREHHRGRSRRRAVISRAVRGPAERSRADSRAASGSAPSSAPTPTRRSPSSPRWTWLRPRARARSSTPARCTPRS